jgi:mxaJ protein
MRVRAAAAIAGLAGGLGCAEAEPREVPRLGDGVLRVCADPNNLPFSNEREEGFENRLAELVADGLAAELEYTWWAQRRGYVRNTLRAGLCDLLLGVPSGFELAQPTRPYYRSGYVFLTRGDRGLDIESLDDPRLRTLRIGVHVVGDDYTNTPPAHALANRGIVNNVRGYTLYGDYTQPNPPARLVEAVASGEVDVAIVWGPLAGYFAPLQESPLELHFVHPQIDPPFLPFVFDIAMGVRRGDSTLARSVDSILVERAEEIDAVLAEYGVPRLDRRVSPGSPSAGSGSAP